MTILLRPPTTDEMPEVIRTVMRGYTEQKIAHGGVPPEAAWAVHEEEIEQYFPGGALPEGQDLFLAVDPATDEVVGRLWMAVRQVPHPVAYIYDVEVTSARRGQGIGRQLMAHAEAWAQARAIDRIALHVFGDNLRARALYRDLGYVETNVNMTKVLSAT